jgi:ABC-type enterochelin transport system ATPase subunit
MDQLASGSDKLLGRVHAQEQLVRDYTDRVNELNEDVGILGLSSTVLENLLKSVSVESLATVEKLVSYGLQVSFHDLSLSLKIEASQKRGVQFLDLKFVDKGVEAPILGAFGGGPASVCAFLLRLLVCRRLQLAPVILLDEQFSFVSAEYRQNVAKLLRELSDKLGIRILLVTHERAEYLPYATHAYEGRETSAGTVFTPVTRKTEA